MTRKLIKQVTGMRLMIRYTVSPSPKHKREDEMLVVHKAEVRRAKGDRWKHCIEKPGGTLPFSALKLNAPFDVLFPGKENP